MKTKLNILRFGLLAVILGLMSCAKDASEMEVKTAASTGQVFSFGFERVQTSRGSIAASGREGYIESVAIIIETEDGGFYKFLTTAPEGSANAFYSVEYYEDYGDEGEIYQLVGDVKLELPAETARFSRVALVANYAVLGVYRNNYSAADITDQLLAADSWEELLAIQATAPARGVKQIPGLLASRILTDAEVEEVWASGEIGVLKLKRLATRIEMNMNVYADYEDGSDPVAINGWQSLRDAGLLEFKKIIAYGPKSATYLFPDLVTEEQTTAIPQYEYYEHSISGNWYVFYIYGPTGNESEPLSIYMPFGYRPKSNVAYNYAIAGFEIENTSAGKSLLLPNSAYEVDIPFVFPFDQATIGDWDNSWGLVAKP